MDDEALKRIEARLDAIVRLLAAPLVQGKTQTQSVQLLDALGLDRAQIADICNTRAEVVRARLSEAKRGEKAARPRKAGTGKAK